MEESKISYGLKLKGKDRVLGVRKEYNEGKYFANGYSYYLDEWEDEKWTVEDYDKVVMAKWTSEDWYNSSYDEPVNPYHPLELEIIKIVTITVIKETDLEDEVEIVNQKLKSQGYSIIELKDYLDD